MREGADRLRNNTNSFLSGELLGLVPVRISVSGESDENSLRIKSVPRHHPSGIADGMCIDNKFLSIYSYERNSFQHYNTIKIIINNYIYIKTFHVYLRKVFSLLICDQILNFPLLACPC